MLFGQDIQVGEGGVWWPGTLLMRSVVYYQKLSCKRLYIATRNWAVEQGIVVMVLQMAPETAYSGDALRKSVLATNGEAGKWWRAMFCFVLD